MEKFAVAFLLVWFAGIVFFVARPRTPNAVESCLIAAGWPFVILADIAVGIIKKAESISNGSASKGIGLLVSNDDKRWVKK